MSRKLADKFIQPLCLFVDCLENVTLPVRVDFIVKQKFGKAEHGRKRGSHFMTDGRNHFILDPLHLFYVGNVNSNLQPYQPAVSPFNRPVGPLIPSAVYCVLML